MKNQVKIDFDGSYYAVYSRECRDSRWWFFNDDRWVYKSLFKNYEDAKKAAEHMLKFPEYLP